MLGEKYKINEGIIRASFDEDDDHMAGASIVTLRQLLKKNEENLNAEQLNLIWGCINDGWLEPIETDEDYD